MKKYTISLILIALCNGLTAQEATIDKEVILEYFNNTLNSNDTPLESSTPLRLDKIGETREELWNLWKSAVDDYDEDKLIPLEILENRKSGKWTLPSALEPNAVMPYYYGCNSYPSFDESKQYPLFLYMHGSGDKAQEWESGIGFSLRRFYSPGIYFIPQIPNAYGEYYRWAIQSKQWAWEKLLRLAFVSDNIDPNKVYFFGISEGAYGSQRLASFYADYLAGAGPMAGGEPLKNAPMENVANIAFSLRTGALDSSFGRNILTQKALEVADELEKAHPGYYNHFIEVIEGDGHSIDYKPTTPWLAQFTRDPHPDYFYWENYAMYGRYRKSFYNLRVIENATSSSASRACYEMKREGNTINLDVKIVDYTTTYTQGGIEMYFDKKYSKASKGKVRIYLNEKEYDLSQPVRILLNGEEIFNANVPACLEIMLESCAHFYDPERLFPAAIDVDIAERTASATSVDIIEYESHTGEDAIYDISGRRVKEPLSSGIYIRNGKTMFVR